MKQCLAFLMISTFFLNSWGTALIYKLLQLEVKHEVKATLRKAIQPDQLTIIKVNKNQHRQIEWFWFGLEDEFKFKGIMYDVVKKVSNKTSTTYYCIADLKESAIADKIDQLLKDHMRNSRKAHVIKKLIAKLIFTNTVPTGLKENKAVICNQPITDHVKGTQCISLDIIVPPPQLFC